MARTPCSRPVAAGSPEMTSASISGSMRRIVASRPARTASSPVLPYP